MKKCGGCQKDLSPDNRTTLGECKRFLWVNCITCKSTSVLNRPAESIQEGQD
jgi:hypothetical protein